MVEQVKNLQKTNPEIKAEWSVFCDTYVNGTKDPARHTAETLQTFLDKYGGAQAAAQSVAGYGMWQPAAASKTRPGPY
jgi:hypothetical protein